MTPRLFSTVARIQWSNLCLGGGEGGCYCDVYIRILPLGYKRPAISSTTQAFKASDPSGPLFGWLLLVSAGRLLTGASKL